MEDRPAGSFMPAGATTQYTSLINPPRYPDSPEMEPRRSQDMTTGYQYSQSSAAGNYGAAAGAVQTPIVIVGACPACRVGVLDDHFTCCGIMWAILLFPIGIICCLGSRKRRCNNCGAVFG